MPETGTNSVGCTSQFPVLLTALFIGLKLGNIIDWPWVWVLSPIWIPFAAVIAFFLIAAIVALVVDMATGYKKPKR
jgi:hypothetical protein